MATATDARSFTARSGQRIGHASSLRVARVIWYREVLAYSRDRARLASSLVMPILMIVIFGEGFGATIGSFQEGINYRQFIFPGVICMTILFGSVFSGVSIIWDREFGFLREILVAPISRTAIGLGKLLGGATIAMSQGVILFLLAPLVDVHFSPLVIVQLLAVLFLFSLVMTSVGIAIASRVRSVESFQMITQVTVMPAMFLAGIFFPVNNLPAWMEVLVKINPVTYAVAAVRAIGLDEELQGAAAAPGSDSLVAVDLLGHTLTTLESLAVLCAFGVVVFAAAIQSFRRQQ
jgi:ABC-2 type transport system permease protein